ncbi:MAG: hypothetical protein ABIH35_01220 [Patescibacteria group bacterium]
MAVDQTTEEPLIDASLASLRSSDGDLDAAIILLQDLLNSPNVALQNIGHEVVEMVTGTPRGDVTITYPTNIARDIARSRTWDQLPKSTFNPFSWSIIRARMREHGAKVILKNIQNAIHSNQTRINEVREAGTGESKLRDFLATNAFQLRPELKQAEHVSQLLKGHGARNPTYGNRMYDIGVEILEEINLPFAAGLSAYGAITGNQASEAVVNLVHRQIRAASKENDLTTGKIPPAEIMEMFKGAFKRIEQLRNERAGDIERVVRDNRSRMAKILRRKPNTHGHLASTHQIDLDPEHTRKTVPVQKPAIAPLPEVEIAEAEKIKVGVDTSGIAQVESPASDTVSEDADEAATEAKAKSEKRKEDTFRNGIKNTFTLDKSKRSPDKLWMPKGGWGKFAWYSAGLPLSVPHFILYCLRRGAQFTVRNTVVRLTAHTGRGIANVGRGAYHAVEDVLRPITAPIKWAYRKIIKPPIKKITAREQRRMKIKGEKKNTKKNAKATMAGNARTIELEANEKKWGEKVEKHASKTHKKHNKKSLFDLKHRPFSEKPWKSKASH